jgi:hypothetical protein
LKYDLGMSVLSTYIIRSLPNPARLLREAPAERSGIT